MAGFSFTGYLMLKVAAGVTDGKIVYTRCSPNFVLFNVNPAISSYFNMHYTFTQIVSISSSSPKHRAMHDPCTDNSTLHSLLLQRMLKTANLPTLMLIITK